MWSAIMPIGLPTGVVDFTDDLMPLSVLLFGLFALSGLSLALTAIRHHLERVDISTPDAAPSLFDHLLESTVMISALKRAPTEDANTPTYSSPEDSPDTPTGTLRVRAPQARSQTERTLHSSFARC
jgi:hypothetical protein